METWGDYVSSIGISGLEAITKRWSSVVVYRGRVVHWSELVWNEKYTCYFSVSACGKNLEDASHTHGLVMKPCKRCVDAVKSLLAPHPKE